MNKTYLEAEIKMALGVGDYGGGGGGGGLLFNINENIPCEIVNNEDIPNGIEMILFQFLVKTQKWCCVGIYIFIFFWYLWNFCKGLKQINLAIS